MLSRVPWLFRTAAPWALVATVLQLSQWLCLTSGFYAVAARTHWGLAVVLGGLFAVLRSLLQGAFRRWGRPSLHQRGVRLLLQTDAADNASAFYTLLQAETLLLVVIPSIPSTGLAACVALLLAATALGAGFVSLVVCGLGLTLLLHRVTRSLLEPSLVGLLQTREELSVREAIAATAQGELRGNAAEHYVSSLRERVLSWSKAEERFWFLRTVRVLLLLSVLFGVLAVAAWSVGGLERWRATPSGVLGLLLSVFPLSMACLRAEDDASATRRTLQLVGLLGSPKQQGTVPLPRAPWSLQCTNASLHRGEKTSLVLGTRELPLRGLMAVVGPNGAGKSSFLALLAGVLEPTEGLCTVNGIKPSDLASGYCAWMPQHTLFLSHSSVQENLVLTTPGCSEQESQTLFERLGLRVALSACFGELSRGEQRKVLLARTLLQPSRWLLLDEPEVGLDLESCQRLRALLRERTAAGLVVVATHHSETLRAADWVLVVSEKHEILAQGPLATLPQEVFAHLPFEFRGV